MPYASLSRDEIARRGQARYERELRDRVEAEHRGKFLIMDLKSGDNEIDVEVVQATSRLMARRPDAVIYGLRIGYPTAYRLGGHSARSHE